MGSAARLQSSRDGSQNSKQVGEGTGRVAKHSFWKWQSPPQWIASYDCARTPPMPTAQVSLHLAQASSYPEPTGW